MTEIVGSPPWTRTAGAASYGGSTTKTNFQSVGVINAKTDVGAAAINRAAVDIAACVRTAAFAVIRYHCHDSVPAAPELNVILTQPGITEAYAGDYAPTGFPSGARNGDGDCTFTFDASSTDEMGVSGAWAPSGCIASGSTDGTAATYTISGQTVRIIVYSLSTGNVVQNAAACFVVW
jgi:hypothetical protein